MYVPATGLCVMWYPIQLSVATTFGIKSGTATLHWPVTSRVRLVGQVVTTGGWVSVIVTVKVFVAVFPLVSLAMFVTVVVPTGNVDPLAGIETTVARSQSSLA